MWSEEYSSTKTETFRNSPVVLCIFVFVLSVITLPVLAGEDEYPLPFKATDLQPGQYVTGGNHGASKPDGGSHARDLKIRRQKENGEWEAKYGEVSDNPNCQNNELDCNEFGRSIIYRMPLYAPADGEIVSCWRNHPNNTEANKPLRCCNGDCSMLNEKGKSLSCDDHKGAIQCPEVYGCPVTRSGNYIALLTKDNHRILYAHLAPGSIPQALCPFDDVLMNNANIHQCDEDYCTFPAEAVIPKKQRPFVRRGQFLGRAGSSGASSGPHTHSQQGPMHVENGILIKDGNHHPYLIENAWMRPGDSAVWTKLTGWEIIKTDDNPTPLIHPSPFLQKDTVVDVTTNALTLAGSVSSHIDNTSRLQIIAWDVDGDGSIQKQHSVSGIEVDRLASAQPGSGRDVVTVARKLNGDFRIDFWGVDNLGVINLKDFKTTGPVGDVAVTPWPTDTGVVVAVKAGSGNLKLLSYQTDSVGLTRKGSVEGNPIRAVAVSRIRKGRLANEADALVFKGVATAVKTQGDRLRLQTWAWNESNKTLSPGYSTVEDTILGQIAIAAVPLPDDRQMLVTAARTSQGSTLQSWSINSAGELQRRWTKRLDDARHITINAVSDGRFITSYENENGQLMVKGWALEDKGKITSLGQINAGDVSYVSSSMLRRNSGDTRLILTAMRDDAQKLRLIVYDSNL